MEVEMSDGNYYGYKWQTPVGWLESSVPATSPSPLIGVAKKLAYYMSLAEGSMLRDDPNSAPRDRFYQMDGHRGPHNCEIENCGLSLSGVFGFRNWKFPTGIVHYILDHNWQPPEDFLLELQELPEAPEVVLVSSFLAPNQQKMFHRQGNTR
jgi:hypothetical protein